MITVILGRGKAERQTKTARLSMSNGTKREDAKKEADIVH